MQQQPDGTHGQLESLWDFGKVAVSCYYHAQRFIFMVSGLLRIAPKANYCVEWLQKLMVTSYSMADGARRRHVILDSLTGGTSR